MPLGNCLSFISAQQTLYARPSILLLVLAVSTKNVRTFNINKPLTFLIYDAIIECNIHNKHYIYSECYIE